MRRHFQRGDAEAMGGVHRRLRGTGLASMLVGFLVVTYYCGLGCCCCVRQHKGSWMSRWGSWLWILRRSLTLP